MQYIRKSAPFFILIFYVSSINSQTLKYALPSDTSNFRGPVKSCFLYEYNVYGSDTTKTAEYKWDERPTIAYHFDEDKKMICMKRYRGDSISRISYFLYDDNQNITCSVSGDSLQLSQYIYINPSATALILRPPKEKNISQEKAAYQIELISKNTDATIKKYHYDFDDLLIMITSNINRPPGFIHFDANNNIVKKIQYRYHRGVLLKSTDSRTYSEGLLARIFLETADEKWKTTDISYDSLGNVMSEITSFKDSLRNQTTQYKYLSDNKIEINTYDRNGNILTRAELHSYHRKKVRLLESFEQGNGNSHKEISYLDEYGNVIKKYQISRHKTHVKENRFTFY